MMPFGINGDLVHDQSEEKKDEEGTGRKTSVYTFFFSCKGHVLFNTGTEELFCRVVTFFF